MFVELWHDETAWDAFVNRHPAASNYHRWIWRSAVENTFGHKPYYLAAVDQDAICGVLPLFLIRSRLFGDSMVSVPFFSYGGVLESSPDARELLLERAAALAAELGAHHVELRQGEPTASSWSESSKKVAMVVPLPPTVPELWNRLSSRMRNKVRHAEKHGFSAEFGGIERVAEFYPVFAANMRNLGTPVYPRAWFENLCRCAPETTGILTLRANGRTVAGAFLSRYRDTLEAPWIASLPEGRKDYSSVLLYWSFLKLGIETDCRQFDLGRCTPGCGTYAFKRLWGCEERPLYWYHWSPQGHVAPEMRPENPKFRLAIRVWRHLPLFIANSVGPKIVRSIP